MTSQSIASSPFRSSADKLWNAATTLTPFGTSSAACCAAEPCQTPSVREARPPTPAARATVASIRMLPARIAGFSCLSSVACPSKGTVSTRRSAAAQAALFSRPETRASSPALCLMLPAASCARRASRDPMMMLSPARAQRRARPMPAGPVPPRTAMGRGAASLIYSSSCKFRLQRFLCGELLQRQLDIDARVCCVALGGNAACLKNQRLEVFRAGVLASGGTSFARDVFFHQRATVIVGAGMQAELRETPIQLHPGNLNVVDGTGEQQTRQGVHFQMFRKRRPGSSQPLVKQQSVLVNETERNEFGEPSGLVLNFAQEIHLADPVFRCFGVAVHHR